MLTTAIITFREFLEAFLIIGVLKFLPGEDSFFGHLLQGLLGVDKDFSLARLIIMITYIVFVYLLFSRKRKASYN